MDIYRSSSEESIRYLCRMFGKLTIPTVWVDEYPMISEAEWVAMFDPEKYIFNIKLSQYEGVRQGWVHCQQPSMCSVLLINIA